MQHDQPAQSRLFARIAMIFGGMLALILVCGTSGLLFNLLGQALASPIMWILMVPVLIIGVVAWLCRPARSDDGPARSDGGGMRFLRSAGVALGAMLLIGAVATAVFLGGQLTASSNSWGAFGVILTAMIYGGAVLTLVILGAGVLFVSFYRRKQ